jgi:hypothetical protein
MHPHAIKSLVDRLTKVAHNLRYFEHFIASEEKILEVGRKTDCYWLINEDDAVVYKVVKELLTERDWSDKFSEDYLGKKLGTIFREVASTCNADVVARMFHELVTEYENFTQEWTVILPLDGIQMEMDELNINPE